MSMAFQDDIAAAVEVFGVENVGLVWGLGMTQWESPQKRDEFLKAASQYFQE